MQLKKLSSPPLIVKLNNLVLIIMIKNFIVDSYVHHLLYEKYCSGCLIFKSGFAISGINTGSYYAISTLLNQEILDAFPVSAV